MTSTTETEVKIQVADKATIVDRLCSVGLNIFRERHFESNTIYDTFDRSLKRGGTLLRLRDSGGECRLTWKGRSERGRYKNRPELETSAASCQVLHDIFVQLGFQPTFRYEKYRTEFAPAGHGGIVMLDETPIGDFLELEGPGEWIDDTAAQLGFSRSEYLLDSYAKLYIADCQRRGVQPEHMVFASH